MIAFIALTACAPLRPTPPPVPADIIIENVAVVDVASGRVRTHATVGVLGPRIVAIGNVGDVRARPGAQRIDGRGRFLIPGLWDMHTHSLWASEALATFLPAYVAHGVTGIRDMGGTLEVLRAARDSIRRGSAIMPRLYAAGAVLDGPEPVDPSISVAIGDSARARQAVDSLANAGVDFLKVYTLLPPEAYTAVVAAAQRRRLSVAGHVPFGVAAERAARDGQRSIEHLNDELEPFCTPAAPAPCVNLIDAFLRHGTWQVPTLEVLRLKAFGDDPALAVDPRLQYIPAALRDSWLREWRQKQTRPPQYFAGKRERYRGEVWLAEKLWREKVPLLAGSDAGVAFSYPGSSLHAELALLVDAGLPPAAALRAATLGPAIFLAATDSMGTVAVGMVADLVLLRSNPLLDIRATREIETVILRGQVLDRAALDSVMTAVAKAAGPPTPVSPRPSDSLPLSMHASTSGRSLAIGKHFLPH